MPSTRPFIPDPVKLNSFSQGDVGITESFLNSLLSPLESKLGFQDDIENLRNQIKEMTEGIKSLEKTIVSTLFETYKPIIDGVKIILDLFVTLENIKANIIGGLNPSGDIDSFLSQKLKSLVNQPVLNYPQDILLVRYDNSGNLLSPYNEPNYYGDWPRSVYYEQFISNKKSEHDTNFSFYSKSERESMFIERMDSLNDEYNWSIDNRHTASFSGLPDNLKFYFDSQTLTYQGNEIIVDIEGDYNLNIDEQGDDSYKVFTFYATRKSTAELDALKGGSGFLTPDIVKATRLFSKELIPIVSKRIAQYISLLQQVSVDPPSLLMEPLLAKARENFKFLTTTPDADIKKKYYLDNTFLLDGKASVSILGKEVGIQIKSGTISTNIEASSGTSPLMTMVLDIMKIPFEFIKAMIKTITDLIQSLMKVIQIPDKFNEFLTFKWLKDLLSPEALLKFIGSPTGKLQDLPFLNIPEGNSEILSNITGAIKGFITGLINSIINLVETIFNVKLNINVSF